jgi:hypothetical protein
MDITYVLQNTAWACCSDVKDEEIFIDISGVKCEGLVVHQMLNNRFFESLQKELCYGA